MRIQPRRQTLEVWQAVARFSRRDKEKPWSWGGREQRNSISDAEQLLCLMYPAAEISSFRLDAPDETADDVLEALKPLGDRKEIPRLLIDSIGEYMAEYRSDTGKPVFAGGSYFRTLDPDEKLTDKQRELDVVDSFATSISLALATLGFLRVYGRSVHRTEWQEKITELEKATNVRLTAAMVGLLRSFAVNLFKRESPEGRALLRTLNQTGQTDRAVVAELNRRLQPVRASLRDATLGLNLEERLEDLDDPDWLFECGFSWSTVAGAPQIETDEPIGEQPDGVAEAAPYLYFTVVAIDGIADLFSERTRTLGLLNAEQQKLAQALQLRWDLTIGYWSVLARSSSGRWPLEDIPWVTTDDVESDYLSVSVTSVVLQELLSLRATDDDLTRLVGVLEELAVRGRITRRATLGDPAINLHSPGERLELVANDLDLGPKMAWLVSDFAALLLKRTLRAAGLSRNIGARDRLVAVAEDALEHMWSRRIKTGDAAGLWDDPSGAFPGLPAADSPNWYMTERMIECLVMAARMVTRPPIISPPLIDLAASQLAEADHLLSQYQLEVSGAGDSAVHRNLLSIEEMLARSRDLHRERPATALSLVQRALRLLDQLAVARQDASRIS